MINFLIKKGWENFIVTIDLLTPGVPYMEYIKQIKDNPIARKVKIADLKHNSDIQRLNGHFPPKYELYQEALEYLESD